ncbi:MAG: hypothetical protein HPY50_12690 [Firmicutes bacterium]|nr:hypothetical protein [Bacillota bacterium]
MFCTRCRKRAEPGDVFCGGCGTRLSIEAAAGDDSPADDPRERRLQSSERELSRYPESIMIGTTP